jgi:hypothetical protein
MPYLTNFSADAFEKFYAASGNPEKSASSPQTPSQGQEAENLWPSTGDAPSTETIADIPAPAPPTDEAEEVPEPAQKRETPRQRRSRSTN